MRYMALYDCSWKREEDARIKDDTKDLSYDGDIHDLNAFECEKIVNEALAGTGFDDHELVMAIIIMIRD